MPQTAHVSSDQKRQALDDLLASNTFARSDKLKHFIRYICEMEAAGRGREVNEYAIGVEALGRSQGYTPAEDSIVRSTAYVLRQKLQEYYEHEAGNAPLRIDLPKGSYVPVYLSAVELEHRPEPVAPPVSPGRWRTISLAFVCGALLATGVTYLLAAREVRFSAADSEIAAAWGPLVEHGANVLILLGHPNHFLIRRFRPGEEPREALPAPSTAYEWFRWTSGHATDDADVHLFMYATGNSALMGDVFASVTAVRTITRAGGSAEVVPERAIRLPALGQRNVVMVGNPEYSPAVSSMLASAPFTVAYDPERRQDVVIDRQTTQRYLAPATTSITQGEAYGIVTVMPSARSSAGRFETLIFSGANSAGTQAAMEYFASPAILRDLRARLGGRFPPAYQVLVKCTTATSIPITTTYVSHHLLPGS